MVAGMVKERPSRTEWFLDLALRTAKQSTCLRRWYGAIVVNERGHIISTGYNGAPSNMQECMSIGRCWRQENNVPSGRYPERCRAVHAEQNAIIQAGKDAYQSTIYINGYDRETDTTADCTPCFLCTKMMLNAGIQTVIFRLPDNTTERVEPYNLYNKYIGEFFDW